MRRLYEDEGNDQLTWAWALLLGVAGLGFLFSAVAVVALGIFMELHPEYDAAYTLRGLMVLLAGE
jgi:hypothetical protein